MIKIFTLKNGLRIVTENRTEVNSISVGVMVKSGSRNETEDINGISHFLEHMMFKGTEKRNSREIAESIENLGGQLNAYTSKEVTCYYIKNLYTHLEKSIEVLSDMLNNSIFDSTELEREKSVVIEEINMTEDSPEDVLYDLHAKTSFGEDPLAYPVLGSIDNVNSFDRELLLNYKKKKYTPKNSVISICGRFDEVELMELLEKYFGEYNNDNIYEPKYSSSNILTGSMYSDKDIEQLHINLGLKGLKAGHKNGYSLVLLSNIFGGGASSILFQNVREKLGLCYNIYCYPQTFQEVGMLNIYCGLGKDYGEKALEVIDKEIKRFSKEGIEKDLLDINKEKIKTNYILGLESTSSRMFSNAKQILFKNKIDTEEEVINKVDKISMEDIDFVLKSTFGEGIINAAYVGHNVNVDKLDNVIGISKQAFREPTNI